MNAALTRVNWSSTRQLQSAGRTPTDGHLAGDTSPSLRPLHTATETEVQLSSCSAGIQLSSIIQSPPRDTSRPFPSFQLPHCPTGCCYCAMLPDSSPVLDRRSRSSFHFCCASRATAITLSTVFIAMRACNRLLARRRRRRRVLLQSKQQCIMTRQTSSG